MRLRNKTNTTQTIETTEKTIQVLPFCFVSISKDKIYDYEFHRIMNFFEIIIDDEKKIKEKIKKVDKIEKGFIKKFNMGEK